MPNDQQGRRGSLGYWSLVLGHLLVIGAWALVIPYNPSAMAEQKAPEKSWQARIGEATDALAQSFVESISYDRRLYKHDIAGSLAHAAMLAKVGLITDEERTQIEQGLKSIQRDI